jgi:hypothetical protein
VVGPTGHTPVAGGAHRGGWVPPLAVAVALGLTVWVVDAAVDAALTGTPFLQALLSPEPEEIGIWGFIVALFLGCSVYVRLAADRLRRAEQELHGRGFRTLMEASPDALLMTDRQGDIVLLNTHVERLFGYARAELMNRPVEMLIPERFQQRHAVDRTAYVRQPRARLMGEGRELWARRKDGSEFQVEITLSPLGTTGEAMAAIRDITTRRVAEQALRASEQGYAQAFRSSPDPMTISSADNGRLIDVNEAYVRVSGNTREEAIGKTSVELGHWPRVEDRAHLVDLMRRNGRFRDVEVTVRYKGDLRSCLVSAEPVEIAGERCSVGIARDITEYKRLQEQLLRSQKLEIVGRLAGGIAHDFNNLLTVVAGHGDRLLARVTPQDPRYRSVMAIRTAAAKAAALTRQLLAFSRQQVLDTKVLDLDEVVAGAQTLLETLLGERIALVVEPAPDDLRVVGDPDQLGQVLMNLSVNARDAMPDGGTLRIATSRVEADDAWLRGHPGSRAGSYAALMVSDTGDGVEETVQSRVFEPFFSTKPPAEGSGLGLSTVHGIVEQSGGYIDMQSRPERGTSFTVYLPLVDETVSPAMGPPPSRQTSGSETVLIVEDESELRWLLANELETLGYTVLGARDGREALEVCERQAQPIDLLVTDVVMPGMSGPELAARLAEWHHSVKTLFISGYPGVADEEETGGSELVFLQKPFSVEELASQMRQMLDGS